MFHIDSLPRLTSAVLAVTTFAIITAAQTILPSAASATFPQCALSCSPLIQAQTSCLPPAAPVTNQATYDSCFCQSALLARLRISPDGTCDAFCPAESDRQLLQSWYKSFCASGTLSTTDAATTSTIAAPGPSTVTSGVITVTVIINPTSSSASSATPSVAGSGTAVGTTSSSNKSWIDTHWRWVLMIGILLIGLGLIAFLAVCLKRRHRRKLEEKRASLSGFHPAPPSGRNRTPTPSLGPELWGPHQHMAHTHGWEYNHERDSTLASDGALGAAKKSKTMRRDQNEKGGSRGPSRMSDVHEVGSDVPSVLSEVSKTQRRREREQERERERNRDVYTGRRAQSMRGAVTAFERDREHQPRSQTMRERDRVVWQDPEKPGTIDTI